MYIRFTVFWNFSKLLFVLHLLTFRNYYADDAPHVSYGKHTSNHHFRHGAHSVYKIYSVFKLFEFAVCSARFGFFEIATSVMRIMLTMSNIVYIVISDIAHTVYIGFTVFWNFSKLLSVLHSWLFRNYYSGDVHHVSYGKHSLNHHFRQGTHSVYKIYSVLKLFEIAVCSPPFDFSKLLRRWCASC